MTKGKTDPRHKLRQKAIKSLFAWNFEKSNPLSLLAQKVVGKVEKIDKIITDSAPKWPIEKINRIDLAVLRLAVYELYFKKKVPDKVVIDEAIELAKEYGSENSSGFVNGVLGTVYKKQKGGEKENDKNVKK